MRVSAVAGAGWRLALVPPAARASPRDERAERERSRERTETEVRLFVLRR